MYVRPYSPLFSLNRIAPSLSGLPQAPPPDSVSSCRTFHWEDEPRSRKAKQSLPSSHPRLPPHGEKGSGCVLGNVSPTPPGLHPLCSHRGYNKSCPLISGLCVEDAAGPFLAPFLPRRNVFQPLTPGPLNSKESKRPSGALTHHIPIKIGSVGTTCLEQHSNPHWL